MRIIWMRRDLSKHVGGGIDFLARFHAPLTYGWIYFPSPAKYLVSFTHQKIPLDVIVNNTCVMAGHSFPLMLLFRATFVFPRDSSEVGFSCQR